MPSTTVEHKPVSDVVKTTENVDSTQMKSRENELESAVEVKADSVWPAQITVYRDEPLSEFIKTTTAGVDGVCTEANTEWNACGPRCAQTCAYQPRGARKSRAVCESLLIAPSGCYKGCFCISGYVRLNDRCVLSGACPSKFHKITRYMLVTISLLFSPELSIR